MGKKQIEKMNELEKLFYEGGEKNGHPHEILHKIWEDWKKFASYAFNKSHATCYSWVAYQTAWLKAHYPAEYMAAVMTSSLSDIKRVTELMEDCQRNNIKILAPSVNESEIDFSVNEQGAIRFGLSAIKGMGEAAASAIISERETNGPFTDIFDLLDRVDMKAINRKNLEVLAKSGAFDDFANHLHRAQYFATDGIAENAPTYLEKLVRWEARKQGAANSAQMSIFDMMSDDSKNEDHPPVPECDEWTSVQQCRFEKEVIGFYISGHPLDDYKTEMENFTNISVAELADLSQLVARREVRFGGIVTDATTGISQRTGNPYGSMTIEDFDGSYELRLFGKDCVAFKNYCEKELFVFVQGEVTQFSVKKDGVESLLPPKLRISRMMLLSEVTNAFTKTVNFHVRLQDVNTDFCNHIKKIAHQNRGNAQVAIHVDDPDQKMSLFMSSTDMHVDARNFAALLSQMPMVYQVSLTK